MSPRWLRVLSRRGLGGDGDAGSQTPRCSVTCQLASVEALHRLTGVDIHTVDAVSETTTTTTTTTRRVIETVYQLLLSKAKVLLAGSSSGCGVEAPAENF